MKMIIFKDFINGFKKGVKEFGHNISIIINSILLSVIYFIGVGTTSLIAKIKGKKFLDTKPANSDSYWSELNIKKKPLREYFRQF